MVRVLGFIGILAFAVQVQAKTISNVSISGEKVEFKATSNISALEIAGQAGNAQGQVRVSESTAGIQLEDLKIKIPVESLKTGISVRDKHMREKIFMTEAGTMPDITFESTKVDCPKGTEVTCSVVGQFAMRGKSQSVTLPVKWSQNGDQYKVSADFKLALKDFGIEPPSHFGVAIDNNVAVKTAFLGKVIGRVESQIDTRKIASIAPAKPAPVVAAVEAAPAPAPAPAAVEMASSSERTVEVRLKDGTIVKNLSFTEAMALIKSQGQGHVSMQAAMNPRQVASYQKLEEAQAHIEKLAREGKLAHSEAVSIRGSTWHRVIIDGIKTAQNFANNAN